MKEQIERGAVRPVQVVEDQNECVLLGEGLQGLGVLLKDLCLLEVRIDGRLCFPLVGFEPVRQLAMLGGFAHDLGDERGARHKDADEVRGDVEEGFAGDTRQFPKPSRIGGRDGTARLLLVIRTRERRQDFPERQVCIARPGLGVTLAHSGYDIGVGCFGVADKFMQESGFAGAGLAGHKDNLGRSSPSLLKKLFQFH